MEVMMMREEGEYYYNIEDDAKEISSNREAKAKKETRKNRKGSVNVGAHGKAQVRP